MGFGAPFWSLAQAAGQAQPINSDVVVCHTWTRPRGNPACKSSSMPGALRQAIRGKPGQCGRGQSVTFTGTLAEKGVEEEEDAEERRHGSVA